MIYIASDHGGFELKKYLISYLKSKTIEITDMGPYEFKIDDDYPDYVIPTIQKVLENRDNKAILICRNGVGVSMLANKFKGIRTGISWNTKHAISARNDDDTNVLALPSEYITNNNALEIIEAWLNTPFSGEERHKRRLKKVDSVENEVLGINSIS